MRQKFVLSSENIGDSTSLIHFTSKNKCQKHCVKSGHIRSYSGPHFSAFGLNRENRERYGVSFRIQSECEKMRTRIFLNMNKFYAVRFTRNALGTALSPTFDESLYSSARAGWYYFAIFRKFPMVIEFIDF